MEHLKYKNNKCDVELILRQHTIANPHLTRTGLTIFTRFSWYPSIRNFNKFSIEEYFSHPNFTRLPAATTLRALLTRRISRLPVDIAKVCFRILHLKIDAFHIMYMCASCYLTFKLRIMLNEVRMPRRQHSVDWTANLKFLLGLLQPDSIFFVTGKYSSTILSPIKKDNLNIWNVECFLSLNSLQSPWGIQHYATWHHF